MKPENDRREWHLDKTVSTGHIISTLVIAMSVFSWALAKDKRVEQNAQNIEFLTQNHKRLEHHVNATRNEIRQDLRVINAKLDRLIEQRLEGK